eukprot:747567-Hanusia_phi.AAC.7
MHDTVDFPFIDIDNPLDASGKDILEDHYYKVPAFLYFALIRMIDKLMGLLAEIQQLACSKRPFKRRDRPSSRRSSTLPCEIDLLLCAHLDSVRRDITTATKNLVREVVCNYAVTCRIDLFALDFPISADGTEDKTRVSSDSIRIESALGNGDKTWTCVGTGSLQCTYTLDTTEKLLTEGYLPSVQGKIITRCFVAYDVHDTVSLDREFDKGSLNTTSTDCMPAAGREMYLPVVALLREVQVPREPSCVRPDPLLDASSPILR